MSHLEKEATGIARARQVIRGMQGDLAQLLNTSETDLWHHHIHWCLRYLREAETGLTRALTEINLAEESERTSDE